MERPLALVVDRDPAVRARFRDAFEGCGLVTLGAGSLGEAEDLLRSRPIRALLVEGDGAAVAAVVERAGQLVPPPVVVAVRETEGASATDPAAGLYDVVESAVEEEAARWLAVRLLREIERLDEVHRLRRRLKAREGYDGLVGRSDGIAKVREQIQRLATLELSVCFDGEQGSGKELAARLLHSASARGERPFHVLDCSALTADSWEGRWLAGGETDELPALPDQVAGGTLFLEEIANLDPALQERLLGFLDRARAGRGDESAAMRLLAGSRDEARRAVAGGRLLEPLWRRLSEATITLAPLRDRRGDVAVLTRHFLSTITEINHLPPLDISAPALALLDAYGWPGNVQELRHSVEHAVILAVGGTIQPADLPDRVREARSEAAGDAGAMRRETRPFREAKREIVERFERSYLCDLMEQHSGNVTAASQQAGMLRSALQRLLRKYGLKSATFRKARRVEEPARPDLPSP